MKIEDLKVDDLIMVRDCENCEWIKRHFSHIADNGMICCFADGKTSKETNTTILWEYFEPIEPKSSYEDNELTFKEHKEAKSKSYTNKFEDDVTYVLSEITNMLIDKNRKYGNSALEPVRIFSKADSIEQIKVRIDDKLSRLKNQQTDEDEDVIDDLIGYLILLKIAKRNE